jgi:hypothetical protein
VNLNLQMIFQYWPIPLSNKMLPNVVGKLENSPLLVFNVREWKKVSLWLP